MNPISKDGIITVLEQIVQRLYDGCGNIGCIIAYPTAPNTPGPCLCTPNQVILQLRNLADDIEKSWGRDDMGKNQEEKKDEKAGTYL